MTKNKQRNLKEILNHEITQEWIEKGLGTKEEIETKFNEMSKKNSHYSEVKMILLDEMLDAIM